MTARAPGSAPAWRRWIPGSTVILFLLMSAALWMVSIAADAIGEAVLVVVFLAVAAFVPLAWLGVRLSTRPLWALQVRGDPAAVTSAMRDALRDRLPTQLAAADGPEGLFRRCETVLRIDEPACWIGVQRPSGEGGTTVLLLPRSQDRRSIDAVRAQILSGLESG